MSYAFGKVHVFFLGFKGLGGPLRRPFLCLRVFCERIAAPASAMAKADAVLATLVSDAGGEPLSKK